MRSDRQGLFRQVAVAFGVTKKDLPMTSFGSLFTGFGGADIGAMAAGLTPLWGVELDSDIAAVSKQNLGDHIKVANVLDCDPHDFPLVDVLHASPPCPSFSAAKVNGKETDLDIALATKVAEFLSVIQPRVFTLENVWGYRKSQSWALIHDAIMDLGYHYDVAHINSADFGVPQTRRRMIVRAVRGSLLPPLPPAKPWAGWYEAIENLIDDLPETEFAPWQMERLPADLRTMLVGASGYNGGAVSVNDDEPAMTITANSNQSQIRALLMSNAKTEFSDGLRGHAEPAFSVTTQQSGRLRAMVTQQTAGKQRAPQVRDGDLPSPTVTANTGGDVKAIVDCQKAGDPNGARGLTVRYEEDPMYTLTSTMLPRRPSRALIGSRVVSMTPRCLARFQSFPDWYVLPEKKTLARKGIGNAVPPLLMQQIYSQFLTE